MTMKHRDGGGEGVGDGVGAVDGDWNGVSERRLWSFVRYFWHEVLLNIKNQSERKDHFSRWQLRGFEHFWPFPSWHRYSYFFRSILWRKPSLQDLGLFKSRPNSVQNELFKCIDFELAHSECHSIFFVWKSINFPIGIWLEIHYFWSALIWTFPIQIWLENHHYFFACHSHWYFPWNLTVNLLILNPVSGISVFLFNGVLFSYLLHLHLRFTYFSISSIFTSFQAFSWVFSISQIFMEN